ncbi:MAG: hypothetical protein K6G81_09270 [Lachnospiraceae bacterium]|nr:hypothetical protein [Lachnospiraceae bacterium]
MKYGGWSAGFTNDRNEPVIEARADDYFAYAYKKSGDAITVNSVEELTAAIEDYPVNITGTINTSKYVLVENGMPRLTTKSVFSSGYPQIFVYIPQITLDKDYAADVPINDLVRFAADAPITGYYILSDYKITKGSHTGLTLSLYPGWASASAEVSNADVKLQIYDGSAWRDVKVPAGSKYSIEEVVKDEPDPDLSKCRGLKASIEDWSVNGIVGQTLYDEAGFEVSLTGAVFNENASRKWYNTTSWFTNIPDNLHTMVKAGTGYERLSKVTIRFAEHKRSNVSYAPQSASTETIRLEIPLDVLTSPEGECPWQGIAGAVVCTVNPNAIYNILTPEEFIEGNKPMTIQERFSGVFGQTGNASYQPLSSSEDTFMLYVPAGMVETDPETQKLRLKVPVTMSAPAGDLFLDGEIFTDAAVTGSNVAQAAEGIYSVTVKVPLDKIYAKQATKGKFSVKVDSVQLASKNTYIVYEVYADASELPEEDDSEEEEEGGEGREDDDDALPTGNPPDIWVNGKDNKQTSKYNKSMFKETAALISNVPEGCKLVASVTDTTVEEAAGAYSSGKGKKSNIAKASYKKAEDKVAVTAGKTAGTARVWLAAVDKDKKIQASGYFDVTVGTAPKKLYIAKKKDVQAAEAVKSVCLNAGESVKLYALANGTELSPHAKFTWTALKDNDNLEITLSATTHSATIKAKSAPTDGKALKAAVSAVNDESLKKVNCSVMIVNELKSVKGLSEKLTLESALESGLEQTLDYTFVCADGTNLTTDKIKVYATSALAEGTGYSNNGKKFSLSSKSKVKVSYKNGEFTLKAPKKTADGTALRVLVVATHADKTIDVFESGVITIGKKAE